MRAYGSFLLSLALAALIGATLAYPAFELTSTFAPWPFHRVASRITMLALALELIWLCRRLEVRTKRDFGYGLPWRTFLKVCCLWGVIGVASASLGAAFLLATHLRALRDPAAWGSIANWVHLLRLGASSGIAVALIEETVMRGAVHSAVERESGPLAAALLIAPLFALLHFFAKANIAADQVHPGSGFDLLGMSFLPLAHPARVLDSFLAWLAVGLLLAYTRILTGNIAVAIGLHAGWVLVLRVLQESTVRSDSPRYSAWVSGFDGLLGLWLLPWAAAIGIALWRTRSAWVPYASGASLSKRSIGSSISR